MNKIFPKSKAHQTKLVSLNGQKVYVDEDIALLVKVLNNDLNVITAGSCQGSCLGWCTKKNNSRHVFLGIDKDNIWHYAKPSACHNSVFLSFEGRSAEKFLNVIFKKITPRRQPDCISLGQDECWSWGTYVERETKTGRLAFITTCVFPRSHLSEVIDIVFSEAKKRRKNRRR